MPYVHVVASERAHKYFVFVFFAFPQSNFRRAFGKSLTASANEGVTVNKGVAAAAVVSDTRRETLRSAYYYRYRYFTLLLSFFFFSSKSCACVP